jgi:hypothetical protein
LRTGAGPAKTPGGWPGENGSWRGSAGCCGAKCTLRAAAASDGGKIPEDDSGRRAAPDPGLRRRHSGVVAGFEPEGRHLFLLVADAQCEMVQGAAKDGVGAVVERLKRQHMAVPPHEHRLCAAAGGWRQCCV